MCNPVIRTAIRRIGDSEDMLDGVEDAVSGALLEMSREEAAKSIRLLHEQTMDVELRIARVIGAPEKRIKNLVGIAALSAKVLGPGEMHTTRCNLVAWLEDMVPQGVIDFLTPRHQPVSLAS